MKLSDFINSFSLRFREVSNFVRYPIQNISKIAQRRAQNFYENIEIPAHKQENLEEKTPDTVSSPDRIEYKKEYDKYIANGSGKYSSKSLNEFNRSIIQTLPKESVIQATDLDFLPALKQNAEIRGRRGRYRVDNIVLNNESQRVRIYQGIQIVNNKQVWIKEYLLPESDFNPQETRERKDKFEELANINFKSDEGKDFRLITPWDAIASRDERRCYLITEFTHNRISLREYLHSSERPMTSKQVRRFLELVLVSLQYLHTDSRINLPLSQRPHGNLSLDTLLITQRNLYDSSEDEQFFVYLSDFAVWENLFKSPKSKLSHPSIEKDLQDLGTIAFYLLNGKDKDLIYGHYLDPKNEKHWIDIKDISLKRFIRRLLGLDTPFVDANQARMFLLTAKPQQEDSVKESISLVEEDNTQGNQNENKLPLTLIIILLALLGLIGGVSWLLFKLMVENRSSGGIVSNDTCCISEIELPSLLKENPTITYNVPTSETTLKYLMSTRNLVSAGKTFPQEIGDRTQASLQLQLNYKPVKNIDEAIENISSKDKNKTTDFFITQIADKLEKQLEIKQLKSESVAYEAIVVFVPFSDSQRKNSLPEALNGKISFEDLRKIYRGEIDTWKELNNSFPNLDIKVYIPDDDSLINRFKEKLYPKDLDRPDFDKLIQKYPNKFIRTATSKILTNILDDFENEKQVGGIGFGLLSRVYNQCAVYPLSIGEKGQEIQALVQDNGKNINPKVDLCNDKGGYHPNPKTIKEKYPLKYPISVVYPDNDRNYSGKAFVEILRTNEGQSLLGEAGLVPIIKISN